MQIKSNPIKKILTNSVHILTDNNSTKLSLTCYTEVRCAVLFYVCLACSCRRTYRRLAKTPLTISDLERLLHAYILLLSAQARDKQPTLVACPGEMRRKTLKKVIFYTSLIRKYDSQLEWNNIIHAGNWFQIYLIFAQ